MFPCIRHKASGHAAWLKSVILTSCCTDSVTSVCTAHQGVTAVPGHLLGLLCCEQTVLNTIQRPLKQKTLTVLIFESKKSLHTHKEVFQPTKQV